MSRNKLFHLLNFLLASFVIPISLEAATLTVCASGCTYTDLAPALAASSCTDNLILLQDTGVYINSLGSGYVLGARCTTGTWDRIIVRTGVTSTGAIIPLTSFPASGVRATAANSTNFATLIPAVNNSPAIRTVWPGETTNGCSAPCLGEGWTLQFLKFTPRSPWLGGAMIHIGTNDAAFDLPGSNNQNTIAETPRYNSIIQCYLTGDPLWGHYQGLRLSSRDVRIWDSSFVNIFSPEETQAITINNGVGPFDIRNNDIQGSGENIMFGGASAQITYSGTLTSTFNDHATFSGTLVDFYRNQWIRIRRGGVDWPVQITDITGQVVTWAPALSGAADSPGAYTGTRVAGGITFVGNSVDKPTSWRNPYINPPTGVILTPQTGTGTKPAGTYCYRLSSRALGPKQSDLWSASTNETCATLTATGQIKIDFTEAANNNNGTYIYGDTTGNAIKRWSVADGVTTFTENGGAFVSDTAPNTGKAPIVKNTFECKECEGHGPEGPNLMEGNYIAHSWAGEQGGVIVNIKNTNQDGQNVSVATGGWTIQYNIIAHGARAFTFCSFECEGKISGLEADITLQNNLIYDIVSTWGDNLSTFLFTAGTWPNVLVTRGLNRFTLDHNTVFQDSANVGLVWFDIFDSPLPTNQLINTIWTNNISRDSTDTINYLFNGSYGGSGAAGTTAWNASNIGTPVIDYNFWSGANCSNYPEAHHWCDNEATFQAAFVNYTNCTNGSSVLACAINPTSTWHNAGSDGKDIGADIATLNVKIQTAVTGNRFSVSSNDVIWTDKVNAVDAGSQLTKSAGVTPDDDSGARSVQTITALPVELTFTVAQTNGTMIVGISDDFSNSTAAANIDFNFFVDTSGVVDARAGVTFLQDLGSYTTSTVFKLRVELDRTVKWYKDGTLMRTSAAGAMPATPLNVDATLRTVGASIATATLVTDTNVAGTKRNLLLGVGNN